MKTVREMAQKFTLIAQNLGEQYLRQAVDEIVVEVAERIKNRTMSGGVSYQGHPYVTHSKDPMNAYYSKIWGKKRQEAGRTVGMRNYYYTGEMLHSIGKTRYIQQKDFIEVWIQGQGMHPRNKGSISNKLLLTLHSEDQNVNLLGITEEDLKRIAKKLELSLVNALQ